MYVTSIYSYDGDKLLHRSQVLPNLLAAARWVHVQGKYGFAIDDTDAFVMTGEGDVWDDYTGDLCYALTVEVDA